jgi:hypothetical protein
MCGITDHPDDFGREWAYRRGYARAEAVVAALRLICPKQSGAKRKCGSPVSQCLGGRSSNQK